MNEKSYENQNVIWEEFVNPSPPSIMDRNMCIYLCMYVHL